MNPVKRLALAVLLRGLTTPNWRVTNPQQYSLWLAASGMPEDHAAKIDPAEAGKLYAALERVFSQPQRKS
jgi:hypothetical protein